MLHYPNLLLVGGSNRNVGKTTLILNLIKKYKAQFSIIGLKVSSIQPGEDQFHGTHLNLESNFEVYEETNKDGQKDTSKMLIAGAKKVYYIRSTDELIPQAFNSLQSKIPPNVMIICESISLRKHLIPGVFILIQDARSENIKQSFVELKSLANQVITTDGNEFDFDVESIIIEHQKWLLI
jgi:hypothetical protein